MLDAYRKRSLARPINALPQGSSTPLVVAGLFRTANGIGEGARSTWHALDAAGLRPTAVDLSVRFDLVDMETDIALAPMPDAREGVLIAQFNSPELPSALHALDLKRGRHWYVIGFWAWELPRFPKGWQRNFDLVSEIWTPSDFTSAALGQHSAAPPIHTVGHAVAVPAGTQPDRTGFDISHDTCVFLTMADSMSSITRKNPLAAIAAFKKAFGSDPSRLLIVKTRNLNQHAAAKADLIEAIDARPNIRLIDETLSQERRWQLMASSDALISLHRSEGFGLTIAEMMALGKSVVATGWSGNMDFCDAASAHLVGYKLVPCRDRHGVYRDDSASWAEPDIDQAAQLLSAIATRLEGGSEPSRVRELSPPANRVILGKRMAKLLRRPRSTSDISERQSV